MAVITLFGNKAVTVVDDDMYEQLSKHRWHLSCKGYAQRSPRPGVTIFMHREINQTPAGMFTDHINGDKLDNRRANLRTCTCEENNRARIRRKPSKSGLRGVTPKGGRWQASICFKYKARYLGLFDTREEAYAAYRAAARELFGDFAQEDMKVSA